MHTSSTTQHRALPGTVDIKHLYVSNYHAHVKHHTALSIVQHCRFRACTNNAGNIHQQTTSSTSSTAAACITISRWTGQQRGPVLMTGCKGSNIYFFSKRV